MTVLSNIITPSNVLTTTNTATVTNKTFGDNPTFSGGTANGVTYLNGSKVLTSGSALVFDGTNMGIGTATPTFAAGGGIQNKNATFASFRATGGTSTGIDFAQGSDAKGYVFNRDNADIIFGTNSAERIRILSSGEVGIGTSSPSFPSGSGLAIYNSSVPRLKFSNSTTGDASTDGTNLLVSGSDFYIQQREAASVIIATNGADRATIDSAGNLGLGVTPSAWNTSNKAFQFSSSGVLFGETGNTYLGSNIFVNSGGDNRYITTNFASMYRQVDGKHLWYTAASGTAGNSITFTNPMTLDASGNLLVGQTSASTSSDGVGLRADGLIHGKRNGPVATFNRKTTDGTIVELSQDDTVEGTISVSGTTVSYNGGHLSRWAQMLTKPELFKGTVMSNLDEMNVYTKDGQPVDNEQLNKVKVSDTEGDANVAGVFVNWSHDEQHNVDEINMAMTGDMIIRIAQGVTVVRGDLLMSAGDGTAKPQGDDIIRSKTVAKVTSNHVTCTYADGSYCVPCVLMAC